MPRLAIAVLCIVLFLKKFGYTKTEVMIMSKHNRDTIYKMIGLNIAYQRKLKGLSQMDLAEAANISRTHLSTIEAPNMPTTISLDTLLNIADALEIPVEVLVHFN